MMDGEAMAGNWSARELCSNGGRNITTMADVALSPLACGTAVMVNAALQLAVDARGEETITPQAAKASTPTKIQELKAKRNMLLSTLHNKEEFL
jgi:hypothetical protein